MSITSKNPICAKSLKLLGDYWTMMIIDMLSDGPLRFCELEQKIKNVNSATLSLRLKNMQQAKLINRTENSRADVSYELTEIGKKALPILGAVNEFSDFIKTKKN